jgi:hypothetical protein
VSFFRAEPRRVRDPEWPEGLYPFHEFAEAVALRAATDDRYVEAAGHTLLGFIGEELPASLAWSIYKVRSDNLPDEERDGAITPLELPEEANLAEGSHVVMFPRNVVGVIAPGAGPAAGPGRGAITAYMEKVLEESTKRSIRFTPIPRPEVMSLLDNATLVSARIRIAAGDANAVSAVWDTIGEAARDLARDTSGTSIDITIGAGRAEGNRTAFRRDTLRHLRDLRNEAADRLESLQVSYISEDVGRQVVDLLGDDISVFTEVPLRPDRRGIPADEAHEAIRTGYNAALDQLNRALGLG